MIKDKSFLTWDGNKTSTQEFLIREGLQQGTVNSPILFNIFTCDILKLFDIKNNPNTNAIAFADDLIIYTKDNKVSKVHPTPERVVDEVNHYYSNWNLKVNPSKCETILFRKPHRMLSSEAKAGAADFEIQTTVPGTNDKIAIPHKKSVKYLGFHINQIIRGNLHPDTLINKAKKAFSTNSRVFYNSHFTSRAKVILYMLLIRPILAYAAPIWWNSGNSVIEKIRAFERKCLRVCLKINRSTHTDFQRYVNNKTLYDKADIPRIDHFILKLTRDYFSSLYLTGNNAIRYIASQPFHLSELQLRTCYILPQAVTYCDAKGLLQDANNVPVLYHWRRNKANKRITITLDNIQNNHEKFIGSTDIPNKDLLDFHRLKFQKYTWLNLECPHMQDLLQRKRHLLARRRR